MMHSPDHGFKRSNPPSQFTRRLLPTLAGALALMSGSAAWGQVGTSTALYINPTAPTSGEVISFEAVVTSAGVGVTGGTVTFTDTYNSVTEPLGTVQVQGANGTQGTALFRVEVGGVGTHTIKATYNGDKTNAASSAPTQAITFAGPYLSATALSSTGTGPYSFTGTVSAFGPSAPTGSVTFTDATTTANLGTANLNAASLQNGFTPYTSYSIPNLNNGQTGTTISPAIGDFNGDGRPDYAVPQNGSTGGGGGGVAILLGSGNGTFTNGTFLTTASTFTPSSVVVGDFNGDGKQDLAVLNAQGTGSVNIYLGNGDGTFQVPTNFPVAASASSSRLLAVGDFNQDGKQDLVATNFSLNQVAVILGNGNGGFGTPSYYTVDSLPWNVVVGDINHDGILDLAVASDGGAYASILVGNGDGTFKPFTTAYTKASQVGSVALGDFNGDGWLDLATTSAPDNSIYILLNQKTSTPSFAAPVAYSTGTGSGVYYLTVGDFNRDGKLDIIAANNGNATVDLFLGNGDGTLQAPTSYSVGGNAIFATEADINGDDRVDLTAVIDSGTTPGLSVLLSGQTETATLTGVTIHGCSTQSVVATYNGDTNYGSSTSSALSFTPTKATTSLTLGMSPTTPAAGAQVTLTATLAPYAFGTTTSNGEQVLFYNNGTFIGSAMLSSGVAAFNYVMPNASYSFQATYGGDCAFSASNSGTVAGTPLLASTLTWATPAPITYGTALSAIQLNAQDTVVNRRGQTVPLAGTYTYTPGIGTVLPVGTSTLNVVFTPNNPAYGQEAGSVNITVNPAPTYITWPTPDPISYGTPLTSFQLDATASTGIVNVPLGSFYNITGITTPGSTFGSGFDGDGFAYSTSTLGGNVTWKGMTFVIGPANAKDVVSNETITLPAGNYTDLYMLGAMVNNIPQATQTFTINYTTGSPQTVSFNMSDWFNAKGWPGESVISCSEDRNTNSGGSDPHSACLYGYDLPLDSSRIVSNIVLPNTGTGPGGEGNPNAYDILFLSMNLATPQIPGTFVYTPPAGTIEPVGTDTLNVTFTPSSSNYSQSTGTVQLVVAPAVTPIVTTTINWPTPAPISYGTPLSATQLDAVATGQARPTPVTPTLQLSIMATDQDGAPYSLAGFDGQGNSYSYNALNNGSINYAGATFTLGQPGVPDALSNGAVYTLPQAGYYSTVYLIGAATTTGQTNEPFVLTYSDLSTTTDTVSMSSWTNPVGYSGESTVAATTYGNTKSGAPVSGTHDLYGYQIAADPTRQLVSVTLPSTNNVVILALGFGSNQQVSVPGTYTYTPAAGAIEPVGSDTLKVSFVPTDTTAYTSASGSTTLIVNKATPVITWPTPAPVTVGTKLSGTQLDATAATPQGALLGGTFVYNPPAGTTMTPSGTYTLSTTFTPTDQIDYTTASASVQLIVGTNGNSSLSGSSAYANCCFFSQPDPYTITVGGVSNLTPTGTVQVVYNGNVIGSGTLSTTTAPNAAASFLVSDASFYPGNNTVTLKYLGDSNYSASSTTATIVLRQPAITVNPATVLTKGAPTTIHYQFPQQGSINYNYNPGGASSTEFTDANTGTCKSGVVESAGFDCTFVVNFTPTQPGTRRGVIQVDFTPSPGSQSEPTLYLFLSGISNAPQITLSSATQSTLNSSLSQPQNAVFSPTDSVDATLFIANGNASQVDTLSSNGGSLTKWNAANTAQLVYPADLTFDAFDNLVMPDARTARVYSYSPVTLTATTLSTGAFPLGYPTQARFDLAGYLYIADGGNTPQIVAVPGQAYQPATLSLSGQTISFPQALAVDNTGTYLYIGDGDTNQVLQAVLNGNGGVSSTSQVNISPCDATVASCAFNAPAGFAFSPNGDMYVTDSGSRVLKIPSTHISSGTPTTSMPFTGLINPSGITLDGAGNIYVTDVTGFITKLNVNAGAMKLPGVGSTLTTTVTNTGNLNLSISAITLGNGSNSSFTETDTCRGTSVVPGGTCTITVKYANATKGFDTLTILGNEFTQTGVTIALTY